MNIIDAGLHSYVDGVLAGRIIAGQLVQRAVRRHVQDLDTGDARGLHFDPKAARRAIGFFDFIHHSKGEWAGQPFHLAPWQQFILWCLFGWKRADGFRRFRSAYVEVARKNGKTTLAAGLGLYLFLPDGEPGAEIYTAATKRDQARIAHGEAVRMVRSSTSLQRLIRIQKDNLCIERLNSKYEPLGGDADSTDGLNPHGLIIDELHAHKTRRMFDVLDTSTGSRRQPLLFCITTAGHGRESVCRTEHNYAVRILEGKLEDDTAFAFIASIDAEDDWLDEACWPKANPNLGVSLKLDDLQRKAAKARELPSARNSFLRLHLGVWTEQSARWLSMEAWERCAVPVDPDTLLGRPCFAGLDLASTTDLAACVLAFPDDNGGFDVLPFFWCPEDSAAQRERTDRVPYTQWARAGHIEMTPGNSIDYRFIRRRVNELGKRFKIKEIPYDPYNATHLATELGEEDGFKMIQFRQGTLSMNEPCKHLEILLLNGQLRHGGHPVLAWNAENVSVRTDASGNIRPDKEHSAEKIDGLVALIMAIGRAIVQPLKRKSYYATHGV